MNAFFWCEEHGRESRIEVCIVHDTGATQTIGEIEVVRKGTGAELHFHPFDTFSCLNIGPRRLQVFQKKQK